MTTRRDFLKTSAMGVTVSFLAPSLLSRSAFAAGGARRVLVVLQMAGGNDAVNTFIPYADSRYRSLRPTLAIADSGVLKIDDRLGMHPSMSGIKTLYERGKFAFVNNVGFPTLDRSHFRCQDVWQTGDESYGQSQRGVLGWVGRYADLYLDMEPSSLTTLSLGNRIPLGMRSEEVLAAVVPDINSFDLQNDYSNPADRERFTTTVRSIYEFGRTGDPETVRLHGEDLFESIDTLKQLPASSATIKYPTSNLGRAFDLAARVIAGNVGTHVIWINTGGFDTHSQQANMHSNLLRDVSDSLLAFYDDLAARRLSKDVVVMGWSEFGRRVSENASNGTDHGKAGPVLLVGDAIKGGRWFGELPDLSKLDSGDLPSQIDFRSVYWTLIQDWLRNDPLPVLGKRYENLGFIAETTGRRRAVTR